jgi:raffinose/stachyose/melibiose transport system permease protein
VGLSRYTRRTLLRELVFIMSAGVYCVPFYLLIALALQTTAQHYRTPLSFPWPPQVGNSATAWNTGGQAGLAPAPESSVIIALSSVAALIVIGSLCVYTLARRMGRLSTFVYISTCSRSGSSSVVFRGGERLTAEVRPRPGTAPGRGLICVHRSSA